MTKPSTDTLKETLQELVTKHNEALQVQAKCKEQIIAVQAVIQDRTSEDGDTEDSNSTDSAD